MALKAFCDICGSEIKSDEEVAKFISFVKRYPVNLENPNELGSIQAEEISLLLCQKCKEPIDKQLEQMKNKYAKVNSEKR